MPFKDLDQRRASHREAMRRLRAKRRGHWRLFLTYRSQSVHADSLDDPALSRRAGMVWVTWHSERTARAVPRGISSLNGMKYLGKFVVAGKGPEAARALGTQTDCG